MPNAIVIPRPARTATPRPASVPVCNACAAKASRRVNPAPDQCADQNCVHHESCALCGNVTDGRRLLAPRKS